MPNSILPQEQDGQELFNTISSFFSRFKIGDLLSKCNARKEKGVPVLSIFKYKLCNNFIINGTYFTAYSVMGMGSYIIAAIFFTGAILVINDDKEGDEELPRLF